MSELNHEKHPTIEVKHELKDAKKVSENKSKNNSKLYSRIGIISISVLLILVAVTGSMFIRVGAQTLGGKIFDSLGFHSQALGFDSAAKTVQ